MSRRRALDFLLGLSATAAPLWLFIESLSALLPRLAPRGPAWYLAFLALSACGGLWRSWPKKRVEFPIPLSGSLERVWSALHPVSLGAFEIACGDLFASEAVAVIPVNEYFDGELGDHVRDRGEIDVHANKGKLRCSNRGGSALATEWARNARRSSGTSSRVGGGSPAVTLANKMRQVVLGMEHKRHGFRELKVR